MAQSLQPDSYIDAGKASAAVVSIFKTLGKASLLLCLSFGQLASVIACLSTFSGHFSIDEVPDIDSSPWENNGVADLKTLEPIVRQVPNSLLKEGKGELVKVNFAYPTRKNAKVFDQIDLDLPAGKVVALVGSSGSGKSTVVQLLERFYDPVSYQEKSAASANAVEVVIDDGKLKTENGIVKMDHKDMREQDIRWLRNSMGYVGQEPVLFNDTIYNNIALGKQNCTKAEVEQAAKHANAYDFIMGLESGFDTMVGIGGGKISGGQKQRVAIGNYSFASFAVVLVLALTLRIFGITNTFDFLSFLPFYSTR